ncbi:Endoglucanase 1 [Auxenochlorella protothecoides]|uniref:Endoglucanase n=1 Tax=Auxenochlorella protothecoides TaxID=3075 RepID=A0A087SEN0_AUXPR|nr:Endoglucanase 1 [Auxenochlorella protothecoides]KFM24184.1 Endoglucanase 1 [Auxenochlorella protothecoides]
MLFHAAVAIAPWRHDQYDAGDFLKVNLPMGISVSFLAWSVLEFPTAFQLTASTNPALDNLRLAATYLMDCHVGERQYVGQIGDPAADHQFWGRPEEQNVSRPAYVWLDSMPASDLLGAVSAALASSHLLFKESDAEFATALLSHARELYAWAKADTGLCGASFPAATKVYASSRYLDKLMYAAAWLFGATGEAAYAADAHAFWNASGGYGDVFPSWDSTHVPAVNLLLQLASQVSVKLTRTPLGLVYPTWSTWGILSYSTNAAFMMALRASYSANDRESVLAFVRNQLNYALGSTGRSFVVGLGVDPPRQPHHAAASCPDLPAECGWAHFSAAGANPQVLTGALVGGPPSGDGSYVDLRSDYKTNEVAITYNAGFAGALAGAITLA